MRTVFILPAILLAVPAVAQPIDIVPEMRDAVAAAALPPMTPDPRLAPTADDARAAALPAGWSEAPTHVATTPAVQAWQQRQSGWPQAGPAPLQVVQVNTLVPVLAAYGGWNRGWGGGWNGGYSRGYYGRRCRSSGTGALVGSVAGASIGYGLSNPWNRSTGVIFGGLVGALAGSAIERSGRC